VTETAPGARGAAHKPALGQLLVVGIPGPQLDSATLDYLHAVQPGAVILFRRNTTAGFDALLRLVEDLHALPWKPLVSIDHEGGRVVRLDEPFTRFPPMAALGRLGSEETAEAVGEAMGRELAAAGIDLVYAPVLDVASRADNPVIGDRALSADPRSVATLGCAVARGLRAGGVLPCGKHFPGHGDTDADSHLALPRVEASHHLLLQREIVPFRAAVEAGIPALMTAHVLYPALDPLRPATLSPRILGSLLREELGFRGVLFSDDLEMAAIAAHHELGAAALQALQAGADALLLCQTPQAAIQVHQSLERAWEDGCLPSQCLERALGRWQALRDALPPTRPACALPSAEHRQLAEAVARAAAAQEMY